MNVLTFIPLRNELRVSVFSESARGIIQSETFSNFRGDRCYPILTEIKNSLKKSSMSPDFAVLKVPFGGEPFKGPVLFNGQTLKQLSAIIPFAPLPIPAIIEFANAFEDVFPHKSLILVFETAFFVDLPENERYYAISKELSETFKLRRFGYHGLFHSNTYDEMSTMGNGGKIISICLEPRPEIAAIKNGKAVFVTGGATPLEGLPGEEICGEIDPFIITTIADKLGWGPEQINHMLCSLSGISGILGTNTKMPDIFAKKDKKSLLARNVIQYKILLACGAAIASMQGCDAIVFSGIYHELTNKVQKYLEENIRFPSLKNMEYSTIQESIEVVMVKHVLSFIQQNKQEKG